MATATANEKVTSINNIGDYNWSINIAQGIVAFIEGLLVGEKAGKSGVLAIIIIISSVIPNSAFTSWTYNEKLWEIVLATILGGGILEAMYKGGFVRNAILSFVIDTSSQGLTDSIYNSYILGGVNPNVAAQRLSYPEANYFNRVVLG